MNNNNNLPPAIACTLQGAYLIEASAGTGKTWTLTGIILRLLIEEKYAPERIIATTFTRAAAAEMQERIFERLTVFHRYLTWLKSKQGTHAHWFGGLADGCLDEIVSMANDAHLDGADDPINVHLLGYLLSQDAKVFDDAIRRTGLLLATLDKLFVGTLDSLAQKWLKEFSAEIGHEPKATIMNDSDDISQAIIHDNLRQEHARLMYDEPKLYDIIRHTSILTDTDKVRHSVKLAMQFFGASIDEVVAVDESYLIDLQRQIDELVQMDLSSIEPFFDKEYRDLVGVHGGRALPKQLDKLPQIICLMATHGLGFVRYFEPFDKMMDDIKNAVEKDNLFKAKYDENAKQTLMGFIERDLMNLVVIYHKINDIPNNYRAYLYRKIALDVQQKTPIWLENQHKTTFTIQMDRLNQALKRSPNLARHIRHHYPVALIDESQDVNGSQVELIYQVYLKNLIKQDKDKPMRGFVLLVGDPKQAIYRFRGGDVANYNLMKNIGKNENNGESIINKNLTLTVNRRSNKALIDALNVWFSGDDSIYQDSHARLGDGIFYQTITAHNDQQRLSWQQDTAQNKPLPSYLGSQPLAMLHLDYDSEYSRYEFVAWHINSLLQGGQSIEKSGISRPIKPSDIAVLSVTSDELTALKTHLDTLHIPSVAAQDVNVFGTQAGCDIYALLAACVDAGNIERLGRLLTSSFFGLTLDESLDLLGVYDESESDSSAKSDLLIYLNKILDKWRYQGIATALNFALSTHPFTDESLWLTLATMGERYLADVWQIIELAGDSQHLQVLSLLEWYETQMTSTSVPDEYKRLVLPSESGVNLLTIHKSKGLEFPIVYVLGLEKAVRANETVFYPYSDEQYRRRISPTPHDNDGDDFYKHLDDAESIDERKRLGYVALTRASEQMYMVAQDLSSKRGLDRRVLYLWCECDDKVLSMPSRMAGRMDWLNLNADDYIKTAYQSQDASLSPIPYQSWSAIMPTTQFFGVYQTSFTALISRLDNKTRSELANMPDHDELVALTELDGVDADDSSEPNLPNDDIRTTFMRGVVAGDFLHQILQRVETQGQSDTEIYQNISRAIDDVARRLGLYEYMSHTAQRQLGQPANDDNKNTAHRQLMLWLYAVINAPFAASGATLLSLTMTNSVRELGFLLGIKDGFGVADINDAFIKYADKPLYLSDDDVHSPVYRYLKGEIDLMYQAGDKFYVLDYKSNFLGNSPSDYDNAAMMATMDKAGYWLQAAIYQVALHRLLKMRIRDYAGNESRYLGAVEYLFLRGVGDDETFGRLVWQVPIPLVLALDNILT